MADLTRLSEPSQMLESLRKEEMIDYTNVALL
jgi:hypothetical protein